MNLKKLIRQIKNGDEDALEILITEMYPQVYAYLYRKMNQNDKAKDITQEVFLRFIENIDHYHEEDKLINYLFKIGNNLVINYYRSLKYIDDREMDENQAMASQTPHDICMKETQQDIMLSYIQQLNAISKEVIILRYYHEMKFKDIANILDIPESTVKSRHKQALMKLKELMKGEEIYEI